MANVYNLQYDTNGVLFRSSYLPTNYPQITGNITVPELTSYYPEYSSLYLYGPEQRFYPDNSNDDHNNPGGNGSERTLTGVNQNTIVKDKINAFMWVSAKSWLTNDPAHYGDPVSGSPLTWGKNGNGPRYSAISRNIVMSAEHFTGTTNNMAASKIGSVVSFFYNGQLITRTLEKALRFDPALVLIEKDESTQQNTIISDLTAEFIEAFDYLNPSSYLDLLKQLNDGVSPILFDQIWFILNEPLPEDFITPYILSTDAVRELMLLGGQTKTTFNLRFNFPIYAVDQLNYFRISIGPINQYMTNFVSADNDESASVAYPAFPLDFITLTVANPVIFMKYLNKTKQEIFDDIKIIGCIDLPSVSDVEFQEMYLSMVGTGIQHDSSSPYFMFDYETLDKPICLGNTYSFFGESFGAKLASAPGPDIAFQYGNDTVDEFYSFLERQVECIKPDILTKNNSVFLSFYNKFEELIKIKNSKLDYYNRKYTKSNTKFTRFSCGPTLDSAKKITVSSVFTTNIKYDYLNYTNFDINFNNHNHRFLPNAPLEDEPTLRAIYRTLEQYYSEQNIFKIVDSEYLYFNYSHDITDTPFIGIMASNKNALYPTDDGDVVVTEDLNSFYYNSEISAEDIDKYHTEIKFNYKLSNGELIEKYVTSNAGVVEPKITNSVPNTIPLTFYEVLYLCENHQRFSDILFAEGTSNTLVFPSYLPTLLFANTDGVIRLTEELPLLIDIVVYKNNIEHRSFRYTLYNHKLFTKTSNSINISSYSININNSIAFSTFIIPIGIVDGRPLNIFEYDTGTEILESAKLNYFPNQQPSQINTLVVSPPIISSQLDIIQSENTQLTDINQLVGTTNIIATENTSNGYVITETNINHLDGTTTTISVENISDDLIPEININQSIGTINIIAVENTSDGYTIIETNTVGL